MNTVKNRQSNIELLRILAAGGVIILHYNNANMGGGFLHVNSWSVNQLVMMLLESVFVCAVNLFILISGYFMAEKRTADLIKPLSLVAQVIIYALMFYIAMILLSARKFSMFSFASSFVPNNWFVILYSALFIISPYLNKFLDSISQENRIRVITVLGIVFLLYPTMVDVLSLWTGKEFMGLSSIGMYGSQDGYTIVNFILMYMIGNLLRDIKPKKQKKQLIQLAVVVILIFGWALLDNAFFHEKHSSWSYCNPLVVIEAVLCFQIFRIIKIKHNKVINHLAAASFSVYILHTKVIGKLGVENYVNRNLIVMLGHMLGCCIAIYLVSWIIYEAYTRLTKPLIGMISMNWKRHRYISM